MKEEIAKIYMYALKLDYLVTSREVFENVFKIEVWNPRVRQQVEEAGAEFGFTGTMMGDFMWTNITPTRTYILAPDGVESKYGNVTWVQSTAGKMIPM